MGGEVWYWSVAEKERCAGQEVLDVGLGGVRVEDRWVCGVEKPKGLEKGLVGTEKPGWWCVRKDKGREDWGRTGA